MQDHLLARLRRKLDYYHHDAPGWVRTVWPRPESFAWFVKNHRADLANQGALFRLGRDHFIDIARFPPAASALLGVGDER